MKKITCCRPTRGSKRKGCSNFRGPMKKITCCRPTRGSKRKGCSSFRGPMKKITCHRPTRGSKRKGCSSFRGPEKKITRCRPTKHYRSIGGPAGIAVSYLKENGISAINSRNKINAWRGIAGEIPGLFPKTEI